MYYNKKRMKNVALWGMVLLLGFCGCNTGGAGQEEQKQESITGDITKAPELDEIGITQAVTRQSADTTQVSAEKEEETEGNAEPTETIEPQSGAVEDTEKADVTDVLNEMQPEELVLHVLTNAEGVYYTSGGVGVSELLGYVEEEDVVYFIMKKQEEPGFEVGGGETVHIGVLNSETGELLQHQCYGNTTADAVMIEKETGLYIVYATECTDFGFYSGSGGVLFAKDGTLSPVWPVTPEGVYDDGYWSGHTVKLNGETLEIYKVIVTEVRPDGIAGEMKTELERTLTLDEILAGAV